MNWRRLLEHAPKDPGPIAKDLVGWWVPRRIPEGGTVNDFLCSTCAGRLAGRSIILPHDSKPIWADQPHFVPCAGCAPTVAEEWNERNRS